MKSGSCRLFCQPAAAISIRGNHEKAFLSNAAPSINSGGKGAASSRMSGGDPDFLCF